MKETHVILHRRILKNMRGMFYHSFIKVDPPISEQRPGESGKITSSMSQIWRLAWDQRQIRKYWRLLKLWQHVNQRWGRAQSAVQASGMIGPCVFVCLRLLLVRLEVLGSLPIFSIQVFSVSSLLGTCAENTCLPSHKTRVWDRSPKNSFLQCFHFHKCLDRRFVSVSLATSDWVCCLALLLSLAFNIAIFLALYRRIVSIAFRKSYKQLMSRHGFCNVLLWCLAKILLDATVVFVSIERLLSANPADLKYH